MRVIGITGGIGSGKSTVTEYLRKKGFVILDADVISKTVSEDENVLEEIRDAFGSGVFDGSGALDRRALGNVIFSDASAKEKLQKIITERVKIGSAELISMYRNGETDYAKSILFFDAPLLFETGADELVDETWLISSDEDKRIARVMERDGLTEEEVRGRMRAQMPEGTKSELADRIIYNNGEISDIFKEIDKILQNYI